jgi:hypothetical protein
VTQPRPRRPHPKPRRQTGSRWNPNRPNSEHAQAQPRAVTRRTGSRPQGGRQLSHATCEQTEKQATDAEAKRLAEQGEYRTLYESVKAKADAADALQERLDAITAQAQAANERRIAAIPESMKSLVPEYDDPLKLASWLDANAAVFSRPTPPPLDGRAGGNGTPAMVTDDEVNEYAARWGLNPQHIDRAKLAKVAKR